LAIPPDRSAGCASAGKNWMNKDSVKPADKLLMLSPKVVLDFDTSWALQSEPNQGTYPEYMIGLKKGTSGIKRITSSGMP
jgi:hypothetical protein